MIYLRGQAIDERVADRFWPKVQVGAPDECWPWIAKAKSKGYGRFGIGPAGANLLHQAPRIALALSGDRVYDDLDVCHHCDNRICCNPAHLFVGSHQDNMTDWRIKGYRQRHTHCKNGHEWSNENTHTYEWRGHVLRRCRACERIRAAKRREEDPEGRRKASREAQQRLRARRG